MDWIALVSAGASLLEGLIRGAREAHAKNEITDGEMAAIEAKADRVMATHNELRQAASDRVAAKRRSGD